MSFGTPVRDFYGKIIGWEEHQGNDIIVRDFYGVVQGRYDSQMNVTRDFYGRIIAQGDAHGMLIRDVDK